MKDIKPNGFAGTFYLVYGNSKTGFDWNNLEGWATNVGIAINKAAFNISWGDDLAAISVGGGYSTSTFSVASGRVYAKLDKVLTKAYRSFSSYVVNSIKTKANQKKGFNC